MNQPQQHSEEDAKQPFDSEPIPDRAVAVWEIVSILISFEIAEWVVLAFVPANRIVLLVPVFSAFVLVLYSERQRGESVRAIGFRFDSFVPAIRMLAIPTLVAAGIILVIGYSLSSIHFSRNNLVLWMIGLPIWALVQQFFLQAYINRRAQLVWGKGVASIAVVSMSFALLHFPNPVLCIATLIGGIVWGAVYQRVQNLFALALSHAALSFLIAMSLPSWLLNNLRVGFKYLG